MIWHLPDKDLPGFIFRPDSHAFKATISKESWEIKWHSTGWYPAAWYNLITSTMQYSHVVSCTANYLKLLCLHFKLTQRSEDELFFFNRMQLDLNTLCILINLMSFFDWTKFTTKKKKQYCNIFSTIVLHHPAGSICYLLMWLLLEIAFNDLFNNRYQLFPVHWLWVGSAKKARLEQVYYYYYYYFSHCYCPRVFVFVSLWQPVPLPVLAATLALSCLLFLPFETLS